jgi:hypothetical protein
LRTPLIAFAGRGVGEAGGTGVGDAPAKPDEGPVTPWHPEKNRDNATTNKTNDICKNAFVAVFGPIQIHLRRDLTYSVREAVHGRSCPGLIAKFFFRLFSALNIYDLRLSKHCTAVFQNHKVYKIKNLRHVKVLFGGGFVTQRRFRMANADARRQANVKKMRPTFRFLSSRI